jgi:diacylglycerol kinase (ATP)
MSEQPDTNKPHGAGYSRVIKAFYCSLAGIREAWNHEAAFRQEVLLCMLLFPVALVLGKSGVERALLVSCLFLILITEIVNTAVEAAIDRVGPERNPLSKLAKDLGSSAVFLSIIHCAVVWLFVILSD